MSQLEEERLTALEERFVRFEAKLTELARRVERARADDRSSAPVHRRGSQAQ